MAIAEVRLWNKTIGGVSDENGHIEFNYEPKFVEFAKSNKIELAPFSMPINNKVYQFPELEGQKPYYGLPGMLADSLPDSFGNRMISEYLDRYGDGRTELSPVEKLCYTGIRGMGALEYHPVLEKASDCENISLSELTVLAEKILANRKDLHITENENAMKQLLQVGSSAGGARAKALIAWNESTGDIKSGQVDAGKGYGYWLLKFDRMTNNLDLEIKPDDIDSTKIEYAYYLMAQDAGLNMSECRLYRDGDCAHFMTKRFDRTNDGGKIHMISLCGMSHMNFRDRHVYSYNSIANIVDRLGLGKKAIEDIFRRMVFSDMTYNFDDHVKNTAFLMNKSGEWSLSPAYDITYAYDKDGRFTNNHQMLINNKYFDIEPNDYVICGKKMGLSDIKMRNIIMQVQEATKNFEKYAEISGVREEKMTKIKDLISEKKLL